MSDESTKKAQGKRLADARRAAGYRSARDAALENNWKESTYRAHEAGGRTIGFDDAERYARRYLSQGVQISARQILFGDDDPGAAEDGASYDVSQTIIPVMGDIGAGDKVEPDYDQPPPDGFDQVELPFPLGKGLIGFRVKGDSMRPKYEPGAIVIVRAEPVRATSQLVGEIAAVKTMDGYRYLKRIMPGPRHHVYNLDSVNGSVLPIVGAKIEWASDVIATIEPRHVRPVDRTKPTNTAAVRPKRGAAK